jgi:hypothetical protein
MVPVSFDLAVEIGFMMCQINFIETRNTAKSCDTNFSGLAYLFSFSSNNKRWRKYFPQSAPQKTTLPLRE